MDHVVPPKVIPITITKSPTGSASSDPIPKLSIGELFNSILGLAINKIPKTNINVPINSEKKLFLKFLSWMFSHSCQ